MIIANATGCSSIWGGSAPSVPFTINKDGHGPAWANSLFEDNAEYGFGMVLATLQRRAKLADLIREAEKEASGELKDALSGWQKNIHEAEKSKEYGDKIKSLLKDSHDVFLLGEIWKAKDNITKKGFRLRRKKRNTKRLQRSGFYYGTIIFFSKKYS